MLKESIKKVQVTYLSLLLVLCLCISMASAQDKPKFTNLKVLDFSITKDALIGKMRIFSQSLGVRCDYCHAENAQGEHDFASDEKEQKKVARTMMIMTNDINTSLLSKLSAFGKKDVQDVTCYTCHHNDSKPRVLSDVLLQTIDKDGIDSAIVTYKSLKDEYYGSSVYDFSENSLNNLALDLAEKGNADNALQILTLNEQQFSESVDIKEMYVLVYMRTGQKEKAIEVCNKLLKEDPNNRWVQRTLKQLTSKK